ncbi:sulfhydryl oxidase 2 isoform 1-T1 [Pholidichthys leucotaenia]
MIRLWFSAAVLLRLLPASLSSSAPLYSEQDPLRILDGRSLKSTVGNSSSAWLVQFYASWCGHCIRYSGTWKALAQDVKEWRAAIGVAVLDCSVEDNFDVCKEFSIKLYPTFKYFRAHSPPTDYGTIYRGKDRRVQTVRQLMVNILQNHTEMDRPKYCPPLEPYSSSQLLPLLGQRSDHYTAIIVEEPDSYLGREVILDLVPFSGVQVVRALTSDRPLLDTLRITAFPTIYLLQPNGTHTHLHSEKPLRFFFSSLLKSLPGVQRRLKLVNSSSNTVQEGVLSHHQSNEPWRDFDRSKVYVADLESALHYLLRVEMATHGTLEGEELKIFKDFVTLVAKLYPNGGSVVKLMETLSDWLIALPLQRIPYQAVLDLVDNKMRISGVFLPVELRWVGCQGSRPGLRGYPCSLWTLFHVLTVQHEATPTALDKTGLEGEAAPVLQVMRRYIRTFFGCEECGRHFEEAAAASMSNIQNKEEQVMWLWEMHNRVNDRLAGTHHNHINDRLAGTQHNRINDRLAGTQHNRVNDRLAGTQHNHDNDRLAGTQHNHDNDRLAGTQHNRVNDRLAGTQHNHVNDRLAGTQHNHVNDGLAGTQHNHVNDRLAGTQHNHDNDRLAGTQHNHVNDRLAGTQHNHVNDRLAGTQHNHVNDRLAGTQHNHDNDRLAGTQHNHDNDRLAGTQHNHDNDRLAGTQHNHDNDRLAGTQHNRVNDRLAGTQHNHVNDRLAGTQHNHINEALLFLVYICFR